MKCCERKGVMSESFTLFSDSCIEIATCSLRHSIVVYCNYSKRQHVITFVCVLCESPLVELSQLLANKKSLVCSWLLLKV